MKRPRLVRGRFTWGAKLGSMAASDVASEVAWMMDERRRNGQFPNRDEYVRKWNRGKTSYYDRLRRCKSEMVAAETAAETAFVVTSMAAMLERFTQATETMMEALGDAHLNGEASVRDGRDAIAGLSQVWDRTMSDKERQNVRGRPELLEALAETKDGDGQ